MPNPWSSFGPKPNVHRVASGVRRSVSGPPVLPGVSEPDFWYDFTDISQLFQDTGHSVAVTANGQEVLGITNKGLAGAAQDISADLVNGPIYTTGGLNGHSYGQYTRAREESLDQAASTFDWPANGDRCQLIVGQFTIAGAVGQVTHGSDQDGVEPFTHYFEDLTGSTSRLITGSNSSGTWASVADDFASIGNKLDDGTFEARINTEDNDRLGAGAGNTLLRTNVGIRLGDLSGVSEGFEHWNGRIYEYVLWTSSGIPTLDELEDYVTAKYLLAWA